MSCIPCVRQRLVAVPLTVGIALALAACGGTSGSVGSDPANAPVAPTTGSVAPGSASTSPAASAAPTSAFSPAASASPTTASPPKTTVRTTAQLKKALLSLSDVPAGFEVDSSASADHAIKASSKDARCGALVRMMNADRIAGSKVEVDRSFSGGSDGPFVDETLDSLGTKQAAARFIDGFSSAVKSCRTLKVTVPGVGSSSVEVRQISIGKIGDATFSARLRAAGGALSGFELIQTGVQTGDVVVGMAFVGLDGPDAEEATTEAVDKVEKTLGTDQPI